MKGFLEKLDKIKDRDREKLKFDPKKDWVVLVIFFIALSLPLMFFYRYLFIPGYGDSSSEMSALGNPQEISLENISKAKLKLILSKWEEKEKKYNELLRARPNFDFLP